MGTNYYSVKREVAELDSESFWDLRQSCKTTGSDDIIHIGKSSIGWCFGLHIIPEMGINDLWEWIEIFLNPERVIMDEYRDLITFTEMINKITCRSMPDQCTWSLHEYALNGAEPGPNNLVRRIVGRGCDAQGAGTWDLIKDNFS